MAERKKIGLVLASIHTGSARGVWSHFAQDAMAEKVDLFVFPGGKLNSLNDLEYLRNPIYALANAHNLEGLISWSSSLGCSCFSEFQNFHHAFERLPFITIADKLEGHPCVRFDAYEGMKNLTRHFIKNGARNIAFLQGPNTHASAIDRYLGFRDALEEAGLPYNARLVSDPFDWNSGSVACAQLFSGRGLRPGEDFDTLIGSSDLMTLPAIYYLQKQGYSQPVCYRAGGFNNSTESKIKPFSTVEIPYTKLSRESFKTLKTLLERPASPISDATLQCRLVIRENERQGGAYAKDGLIQRSLDEEEKEVFALPLVNALLQGKEDLFFETVSKQFIAFFEYQEDIGYSFEVINYVFERLSSSFDDKKLRAIAAETYRLVSGMQEQRYVLFLHEREQRNSALNSLKCELLGTKDRKSLIESLARCLPKIGVYTACLALYKDEHVSECIGCFSSAGVSDGAQLFPARQLFPAGIQDRYQNGIFLVQPLFIENQPLGYFVHNIEFFDGVILEELRSAVSNALKGIFLFEETYRAKQLAERAEHAKTEFFAAVGNNLDEPFKEVVGAIKTLEASIQPDENPAILKAVKALENAAKERQNKVHRLIGLTVSQTDEISFKKTLFNISDVLPELEGEFPLLQGDEERLSGVFALIRTEYNGTVKARYRWQGLEVHFNGSGEGLAKHIFIMIERIILMHHGTIVCGEGYCSVTLPWTTFSGQTAAFPAKTEDVKNKRILLLSDVPFDAKAAFGLPIIKNMEKAPNGKTVFILWNADIADKLEESPPSLRAVSGILDLFKSHQEFFQIPFLCFGKSLSGETISHALEERSRQSKKSAVLFIGTKDDLQVGELSNGELLSSWIDGDVLVQVASSEDFINTVSKTAPDLICLGVIDIEMIKTVRNHPVTAMTPVIVIPEHITAPEAVKELGKYSRVVLCNRSVAGSPAFCARVRAIAAGDAILPLFTGVLVKKAILYFNQHAHSHIFRWKLADAVGISEDYLTRIFRREMGMSLWEYLNYYRVFMAVELLIHSGDTIAQIADKTGFQDQAYFCRVFKKIYGKSPGWLRK
ncbi:MAG: helix-turn-helix domain-containing protein [Treponema sp.]|jgi:DNA-binding LacI/PurR family transcriptional regulator/AraC-like DNA-binding protein|nr:helix-turn-helix domain-containing protein [Treponema sp.]